MFQTFLMYKVQELHLPFNSTLTLHKKHRFVDNCICKEFTMSNKQSTNFSDKSLRTLPLPLVSSKMC